MRPAPPFQGGVHVPRQIKRARDEDPPLLSSKEDEDEDSEEDDGEPGPAG